MNDREHASALMSLVEWPREDGSTLLATVTANVRDYRALSQAGVPRRALAAVFGKVTPTSAVAVARGLPLGHCGLVVLSSPLGVGKSVAAALALRSRLADRSLGFPRWVECEHMSSMSFTGLQRLAVMGGAVADRHELTKLGNPLVSRTMVLDDAGSPGCSEGKARETLTGVLSSRVSTGWWTAITTNLDEEAFGKLYGARIVDRLREAGDWHTIAGKSLRMRSDLEREPPVIVGSRDLLAAYKALDPAHSGGSPDAKHLVTVRRHLCGFLGASEGELEQLVVAGHEEGARQWAAINSSMVAMVEGFRGAMACSAELLEAETARLRQLIPMEYAEVPHDKTPAGARVLGGA